nr:hypothetical protein [uncultured Allomuricauda sp.]
MDINNFYAKIIPPDDYEHRRDFKNENLIDDLNNSEKKALENLLIEDLSSRMDLLVIETLAYIKSKKSVGLIEQKLDESTEPYDKIIIAWCLYSMDKDKDRMIKIAHDNFLLINNDYVKTTLFYYLGKFKEEKLNGVLKSYNNSKNVLLSHNSKAALELQ